MFGTRQHLVGGSQTAERLAEDSGNEGAMGHAIRGGVALAEGAPGAAGLSAMKALGALTAERVPRSTPPLRAFCFGRRPILRCFGICATFSLRRKRARDCVSYLFRRAPLSGLIPCQLWQMSLRQANICRRGINNDDGNDQEE